MGLERADPGPANFILVAPAAWRPTPQLDQRPHPDGVLRQGRRLREVILEHSPKALALLEGGDSGLKFAAKVLILHLLHEILHQSHTLAATGATLPYRRYPRATAQSGNCSRTG
jgi:hypothetical protein